MSGYGQVGPEDLALFERVIGPRNVMADAAGAAAYLAEPRDRYPGRAAAILRPGNTEEVAAIVSHAAARRLALVPYSGGTGLVGGQTAPLDPAPLVVSLERLDRIRAMLPEDGVVIAEAGVVLADLQAAVAASGRLFPLSLASEGSCRLGGLLATNAGGHAVLRYGNARDLCLGIEAVLPDGSVLHGLKTLRKDNTGYDLRNLLIGSEGTLGLITSAVMKTYEQPGEQVTAMLAVPGPAAAVALLGLLRARLDEAITGFELIAGIGMDWVRGFYPDRADPLTGRPDWRVLLEAGAPIGAGLERRLEEGLAAALEAGLATDGVLARSTAQARAMWWFRETIPEANRRIGSVASHDISVPISRIAAFIEKASAAVHRIDATVRINCFGHVGDGNLHFNVFPAEERRRGDYDHCRASIIRAVHDAVDAQDGSISAEHGIGRAKTAELARYGDPAKLAAMRTIKRALDPAGIMNPGAIFGD